MGADDRYVRCKGWRHSLPSKMETTQSTLLHATGELTFRGAQLKPYFNGLFVYLNLNRWRFFVARRLLYAVMNVKLCIVLHFDVVHLNFCINVIICYFVF